MTLQIGIFIEVLKKKDRHEKTIEAGGGSELKWDSFRDHKYIQWIRENVTFGNDISGFHSTM